MKIGIFLLVATLVAGALLFQKRELTTLVKGGDEIQASFSRDYRLRPHVTKVKIAGVPVGVVTDIEHRDDLALVTMKIDEEATGKLRSQPSAAIRPSTLLGGNYYVDLQPGGDPGDLDGAIPVSRTTIPVELDKVLEVLKPSARTSLQRTVRKLDKTFDQDGQDAVGRLVDEAPGALRPAHEVLSGLRGTRPDQDLAAVVSNLESVARVLNADQAALARIVENGQRGSALLARTAPAIGSALRDLAPTMRQARTGLVSLDGSLDQLRVTADDARPAVRKLDGLLTELRPALAAARPVVRDLRPAVRDLRPLLNQLVPTAATASGVLRDIDGAPLERLNGPVMDSVLSPFRGQGEWDGSGSDAPGYKVLAQMIAGFSTASKMTDANGATIGFHPGAGLGTVSETPISAERFFRRLLYPGGAQ